MMPSVGQQLWMDRWGFARALLPPLLFACAVPFAGRFLARARRADAFFALVERYFGSLAPRGKPVRHITTEPPQPGPKRSVTKRFSGRIATGESILPRRQASSHGAPQVRPQIDAIGFGERATA